MAHFNRISLPRLGNLSQRFQFHINFLLVHTFGNVLLSKINAMFQLNTSEMAETLTLSYQKMPRIEEWVSWTKLKESILNFVPRIEEWVSWTKLKESILNLILNFV